MGTLETVDAPRCWRVDLEALAAAGGTLALEPVPAGAAGELGEPGGFGESSGSPGVDALDWSGLLAAGGAATAVALIAWAERRFPDAGCLALTVGPAVRAGLPTAARAHVAARSPLTGRLSEGLVGGELGPRLASLGDGVLITGASDLEGRVLKLLAPIGGEGPRAILEPSPVASDADTSAGLEALRRSAGPGALLAAGPAADRGLRFANLANESDPPSFVGRGGLGLALARLGLKAVHVGAAPVAASGDPEWTARLARSPRLIQRGAMGSIELFEALAARGADVDETSGGDSGLRRHRGCRGCPTPCGWVFERGQRPAAGAHFAALAPFDDLLGLRGRDEQRVVLEACDRAGVDAKESARVLSLLGFGGDAFACAEEIERWGSASPSELADVARGADALAAALDLPAPDLLARAEPIQRLAARTSGGASDPMRSFPFLVDGSPNALARELLAGWGYHVDALDPRTFEAKAPLLWWHERVVAAVDTAGFCAFSAGALLADGLATLDELIGRLFATRPGGPTDAAGGLALGDAVCRARARLDGDREPAASEDAALEAAWRDYREWCAAGGAPPAASGASIGEPAEAAVIQRSGRLAVHSGGPLGATLEGLDALELALPARLDEVLAELVRLRPASAAFLAGEAGSAAAPHVVRDGSSRRLAPGELLRDGDELWLVVALPGG